MSYVYYSLSEQGGQEGNSAGSSYTMYYGTSYFLTGVLSIKDPNSNSSIAAFTDVRTHIKWIRSLYDKHVETSERIVYNPL